jgi:hypothetical protein
MNATETSYGLCKNGHGAQEGGPHDLKWDFLTAEITFSGKVLTSSQVTADGFGQDS